MKKLCFMFVLLLFLFSCGSSKYKEYIKDIEEGIKNIQKSINTGDTELFNNYSDLTEFFNFYSLIAMATKPSDPNKEAIVFKPVKYSGSDKSISADVSITYNISSLKDLDAGIPADLFNNIVKMGLPDKMTLIFVKQEDKFIATSVKFPLRYFYMNVLIPSEEDNNDNNENNDD